MRFHQLLKLIPAILACSVVGLASARLPEPLPMDKAQVEAAVKKKAAAKLEAEALSRAQDRAVNYYRQHHLGQKIPAQPEHMAPGKHGGAMRGRLEKLSCKLGTEDRQARIAVELIGGRVKSFAYYSKWKPRTCSVHIVRDDAWSQWKDTAGVTVVTLNENKGAFLIDYGRRAIKFLFREIDRERFCGMEGKITGSLTVTRGRDRCDLEGVMDEGPDMIKSGPGVS